MKTLCLSKVSMMLYCIFGVYLPPTTQESVYVTRALGLHLPPHN